MSKIILLLCVCILFSEIAFSLKTGILSRLAHIRSVPRLFAVTEVTSPTALDDVVKNAGEKLVVIDYSTTWCGPCKVMLPKFTELSNKYDGNVIFLKCIGDTSTEASQLMKREGVRSVPSFHFWKKGGKIEVVNGARIEEVEAAIQSNK